MDHPCSGCLHASGGTNPEPCKRLDNGRTRHYEDQRTDPAQKKAADAAYWAQRRAAGQ